MIYLRKKSIIIGLLLLILFCLTSYLESNITAIIFGSILVIWILFISYLTNTRRMHGEKYLVIALKNINQSIYYLNKEFPSKVYRDLTDGSKQSLTKFYSELTIMQDIITNRFNIANYGVYDINELLNGWLLPCELHTMGYNKNEALLTLDQMARTKAAKQALRNFRDLGLIKL